MKKNAKILIPVLGFALLLAAAWLMLYTQRIPIEDSPYVEDGVIDLTEMDLDTTVADLRWNWEFYPDTILFPADFAQGDTPRPVIRSDLTDPAAIRTGTHRVTLLLPSDRTYALCGWSIDYGMRAYVNGDLAVEVGRVANNAADAVPRVNYVTLPIVPVDGMAEIVLQYSNFHHYEGGELTFMYVATSELIEQYKTATALPTYILGGGLLLLFVYYLLDFFLRRKSETLFFALLCLLFAIRDHHFYISSLMPWDYDWTLHYPLLFVRFVLVIPLCWLMVDRLYRGLLNKWVSAVFLVGCGLLCALAMALPTTEIIVLSAILEYCVIPFVAYLAVRLVMRHIKERGGDAVGWIITFGIFVLLTTFFFEANLQRILPSVTRGGVTPAGMLVFVFCMMTALGIRANEDTARLIQVQRQTEDLRRLHEMHRAFLSNVSHEMKTPLTVISNYAQLTRVQLENGTANEDARENLLTISLEAQRLAMLTDQLLSKPMQQAGGTGKEPIDPQKLLSRAAALCEPILQKNDNRLDTGMLADCPFVLANYDMIVQVLVNLCVNANRHTRGGRVSITVYAQEDMVAFCVEDSGEGIPPDILPHVFERGVSGDGKTGLGLAICKDVAEAHNGTIAVDSVSGKGTRVTFTLPAAGMEKGVEA